MTDIYKGDIGTIFRATVTDNATPKDISSATLKQLIFLKPDRTKLTKTAAFTTDGSDGKIQYTTILNDLDQVGRYVIQGYIETPAGKWHTDYYRFIVYDNLT